MNFRFFEMKILVRIKKISYVYFLILIIVLFTSCNLSHVSVQRTETAQDNSSNIDYKPLLETLEIGDSKETISQKLKGKNTEWDINSVVCDDLTYGDLSGQLKISFDDNDEVISIIFSNTYDFQYDGILGKLENIENRLESQYGKSNSKDNFCYENEKGLFWQFDDYTLMFKYYIDENSGFVYSMFKNSY